MHRRRRAGATAIATATSILLLLAVGLAVTVFRGAYEQIGNTVALVGGQRRRPGGRRLRPSR